MASEASDSPMASRRRSSTALASSKKHRRRSMLDSSDKVSILLTLEYVKPGQLHWLTSSSGSGPSSGEVSCHGASLLEEAVRYRAISPARLFYAQLSAECCCR